MQSYKAARGYFSIAEVIAKCAVGLGILAAFVAASVVSKAGFGTMVTCHEKFPPLGARVRPEKGTDDEAIKIFGRADHWDFARA